MPDDLWRWLVWLAIPLAAWLLTREWGRVKR